MLSQNNPFLTWSKSAILNGSQNVNKRIFLASHFHDFLHLFCSCREKKDTEVHTLEKDKDVEQTELSDLEKENEALRNKLSSLKNHYLKVVEFARKNNIQLKPRNVPIDITGASTSEDL